MANYNYINVKSAKSHDRKANIVDLIKRAKLDEKKEKRNVLLYVAAAVSALAFSGLVISL